tara:strand:- start:244 stop:564 length:321 start_codon:yes stop_codon:yes gene_type:complete
MRVHGKSVLLVGSSMPKSLSIEKFKRIVVLTGAEWHCKKAFRDCDLFIAVGTSGTVSPASRFVEWARYAGAKTILINLEAGTSQSTPFDEEILGPAETILPELLGL